MPATNTSGFASSSKLSLGTCQAWLYKGSWHEVSLGWVTGEGLGLSLESIKSQSTDTLFRLCWHFETIFKIFYGCDFKGNAPWILPKLTRFIFGCVSKKKKKSCQFMLNLYHIFFLTFIVSSLSMGKM